MTRPLGISVLLASASLWLGGLASAQTTTSQSTYVQPYAVPPNAESNSGPAPYAAPNPGPSENPNAHQVTQQVATGADRVGNGFAQMGEGIKQGAIMTWQAVQDGAAAAAARFNGTAPSPPLVRQTQ